MTTEQLINKKSYEQIKYIIRQHPITFIPYIFLFILLLAVPFGTYLLVVNSSLVFLLQPDGIYHSIVILLAGIYYFFIFLLFCTYSISFYLDKWVITNDRILDMEQKSLFSRTVSELDLYQVQDATSKVEGFFPSIFNYGNVIVQTAGPINEFIFRNVPRPHELRQTILDLSSEDKKFHETQSNSSST